MQKGHVKVPSSAREQPSRKVVGFFLSLLMLASLIPLSGGVSDGSWGWIPAAPDAPEGDIFEIKMKASDNQGLLVDAQIPGIYVSNATMGGTVFQRVDIQLSGHTTTVGKPMLPVIRVYLEVPRDVDFSVNAKHVEVRTMDGFYIVPAQEQVPDNGTNVTPPFEIDDVLYSTDAFYPSSPVGIGETVVMRGHRMLPLFLYPVQ